MHSVRDVNFQGKPSNGNRDVGENAFWHPCKVPLICPNTAMRMTV